jgi:hypothetical protein
MKTKSPIRQLVEIDRRLRKEFRDKEKLTNAAKRPLDAFVKSYGEAGKEALKILETSTREGVKA